MKISRYTDAKLHIFERFIKSAVHSSARAILNAQTQHRRHVPTTIYLFDIGCADGAHSTVLLVKAADEVVARFPFVNYRLLGFEKRRDRATAAAGLYAHNPNVTIHQGDVHHTLASVLQQIPPAAFGLAVIDLWQRPPWAIQEQLSARCRTVDHLVLCCAGGYKRHPDRDAQWQQERIPRENLKRVNKKFTLIGEPWGQSQFVEMYYTNYNGLASARKSLGMVPLQSPLGQDRWATLHTIQQPGAHRRRRERRALRECQMDMFSDMNMGASGDQRKLSPGAG